MNLFIKHSINSIGSALLDYIVFLVFFSLFDINLFFSTYIARIASVLFNYLIGRKLVFQSEKAIARTFPAYIALVFLSAFIVILVTKLLNETTGIAIVIAKLISECFVFIINFFVQRLFIFPEKK